MPRRSMARERLVAFLKENPNPCASYNNRELGELLGISRGRVYQLFPGGYKHQPLMALRTLLEKHPEAALPVRRGGMSVTEIARRIRTSTTKVIPLLVELGYPPRQELEQMTRFTEEEKHQRQLEASRRYYETHKAARRAAGARWAAKNPERVKAIQAKATRKWQNKNKEHVLAQHKAYLQTFLRWEKCVWCGWDFEWTVIKERDRRTGRMFRYGPTCSSWCGRRAAQRARTEAR